ncbi:cold-shock DNA-binding protein family [Tangfeifania diversioriginum]|uniref:Cold-shock DNA-binding protein family n=2 Tax=Tangfeifania diversioriginum TaxID=1168035 RepID=A0A1M6NC08_9BACT|nr:cold-shock DNA-binding protein family [Tangfeifania diversioriginum]
MEATAEAVVDLTAEVVIKGGLMEGKVKWYDAVKGYGFIHTDDDKDVFVHRSGIKDAQFGLETDQAVQFEVKESDRGPVAFDVEVI